MSSHELTHLIHAYGVAAVFSAVALQAVGAPIPGTTVLILAALYAANAHGLPIAGVIAAGILGVLCGTSAGFVSGRLGGEALLLRIGRVIRQPPARVQRLRVDFARHGGTWIVFGRFITGARNVSGLMAGASGMAFPRFFVFSAAAAVAWASINGLEYYWFGRALLAAPTWLQVVLVVVGLATTVLTYRGLRRRALRRLSGSRERDGDERVAVGGGEEREVAVAGRGDGVGEPPRAD